MIPAGLFPCEIQLVIIICFSQWNIPSPLVSPVSRDCFRNGDVGISTIFKTFAHYRTIPTFIVAPSKTFAPEFQFTIIHNLVPKFVSGLSTSVFRITSGGFVQFHQSSLGSRFIIQEVVGFRFYNTISDERMKGK